MCFLPELKVRSFHIILRNLNLTQFNNFLKYGNTVLYDFFPKPFFFCFGDFKIFYKLNKSNYFQ